MKRSAILLGAATLSLAASFAVRPALAEMSPVDKTFVTKAATGGMAEVSLGQLAGRQAVEPAVKQFGARMVADHTKLNDQLKAIARQKDMTLPTNVDSADRATEQRLTAMQGHAFDTAYMRDQVQDHQQDIADFRREAENGQDPVLKQFAQQSLPILQQHLQMAQSINPTPK